MIATSTRAVIPFSTLPPRARRAGATAAASDFGFGFENPCRLASQYTRLFGERPEETLSAGGANEDRLDRPDDATQRALVRSA